MSTVSRWQENLRTRLGLLAHAHRSVAYWARRAGSPHGRHMLAEARAHLTLRVNQVAYARRVLARRGTVATVSNSGLAFVAAFEGFRANVYHDAVGVPTQGYGETQGITPGRAWTRTYALSRLRTRINRDYLAPVLAACRAAGFEPRQNEADALASLAYNCGPGIFAAGHTMGDAIRSKDRRRIADAFLIYDIAGGQHLPGLTRRRRAERAMFLR